MKYYFRTGPFQKDVDAIFLSENTSIDNVILQVIKTDESLHYLNHITIGDKCIVRFNSPKFPIYKTDHYYPEYLESIC